MNEFGNLGEEAEVKNILVGFLRSNVVLEGEPHLVDIRVRDIAVDLYDLIRRLTKRYPDL